MPFNFERTIISDVILIKPQVFTDNRGFFMESYKKSDFEKYGIACEFVQDNHSSSVKNVIRGLHFQRPPKEQAKLVKCVNGKIFDVAVDLRKDSKTFLKWVSVELTRENGWMLFIPKGFAHGFLTLSDRAEVVYKCDAEYSKENDSGIRYDDPSIGISWGVDKPVLSDKDLNLKFYKDLLKTDRG
ncbi:MAG: dTDP-4-dehydrorhamnose 3,5-epimerase [Elusimicrobiales bacterium]|nr:dTDP-4-dehydrorhamnose 3,5-epimerase [Elusimicrobiales bacterium]